MKHTEGFTLIELMVALAIVAVLTTLAFGGYQDRIASSNFQLTRNVAAKFSLAQQQHRQQFGQYANQVSAGGNASANQLILSDASDYSFQVSQSGFRDFVTTITPYTTKLQGSERCWAVQIESHQGFLTYRALSRQGQDTSSECMPNG